MLPHPLHRRMSLWLGLFVASFLAWAWWDSMSFSSSVQWRQIKADNAGGGVFVQRQFWLIPSVAELFQPATPKGQRLTITPADEGTVSFWNPPFFLRGDGADPRGFETAKKVDPSTLSYPENYKSAMSYSEPYNWLLYIPYWLLLLVFVVPWSAFLIWRTRKQRELTA